MTPTHHLHRGVPMSPVPDSTAADFSDPARCAEECRVVAGGLTQLAEASDSGGAVSTHRPAYFYHRVAALLLAAAEHCRCAGEDRVKSEGSGSPAAQPEQQPAAKPQQGKK